MFQGRISTQIGYPTLPLACVLTYLFTQVLYFTSWGVIILRGGFLEVASWGVMNSFTNNHCKKLP